MSAMSAISRQRQNQESCTMQHFSSSMAGEELNKALQTFFGFECFRPFQKEAIEATLSKKDVLLVLPTGGGKSLTFQLPVLTLPFRFTVVICPLIALSKDQVNTCLERDIEAELWNSEASEVQKKRIEAEIHSEEPSIKLLYTTPESLFTPRLQKALKVAWDQGTLFSFAIDEAHCVSTWGHDFRPAYLGLTNLKDTFKDVPIIALTATCTPQVQESISGVLALKSPTIIRASFNRPNIAYQVRLKELIGNGSRDSSLQDVADYVKSHDGGHGIIYARLRKTCDWLASELEALDIDAISYHAGKDMAARNKILHSFQDGSVEVVVATVAFGMGIDKPDVRWVVHWDPPSSLEGFYQESGRLDPNGTIVVSSAGRDGEPSESVVYVSQEELENIRKLERGVRAGAISEVASYAMSLGCKRKMVLAYFNEKRGSCQVATEALCDYCENPKAVMKALAKLEQKTAKDEISQPGVNEKSETDRSKGIGQPALGSQSSQQPLKARQRQGVHGSKENMSFANMSWQSADRLMFKRCPSTARKDPGKTMPVVKRRRRNFNPPRPRSTADFQSTGSAAQGVEDVQNKQPADERKSDIGMVPGRRRFKPPLTSKQGQ